MAGLFNSSLVDTADHHAMLRASVGKLVGGFGRRYFQDVVKRKEKPVALWDAMAEAGFLGAHISEEYGGGGGGLADYNVIVEEAAAQGCPILSLVIGSICAPIIEQHGSAEMKRHWLPGLASGKRRLAFAITEPDAGTNTHKVSTVARRERGGWSLSGTKHWTTAADEVEAIVVVARGEALDAQGRTALSLFIVPADAKGISKTPIETALHVPETSFTLFFDGVILPADALVGQEGQGLRHLFAGLACKLLRPRPPSSARYCAAVSTLSAVAVGSGGLRMVVPGTFPSPARLNPHVTRRDFPTDDRRAETHSPASLSRHANACN